MIKKFYFTASMFFSILAVLGTYIGYGRQIYPANSVIAIILAAALAIYLGKSINEENNPNKKYILAIVLLLAAIYAYMILPDMIIPHGAGDFQNHARFVRNMEKSHALYNPAGAPQTYYGIGTMLYSIYPHTYIINTILPIILQTLSVVGILLIARKFLPEKMAVTSAFIYAFSLTSIWMLEQGFFTQILGQSFFVFTVYAFIEKNKLGTVLGSAGLVSYPHYFFVYLLFLGLEFIQHKNWKIFTLPIAGLLLMLPELAVLFNGRVANVIIPADIVPLRGWLLINGGVLTPTLLSLIIFVPFLFGLCAIWKRKNYVLLNVFFAIVLTIGFVLLAFAAVIMLGYKPELTNLYMAGKLFYLLVFPLSILSAAGLERIGKPIIIGLLAFQFAYFAGYALFIVPEKANLPSAFYEIAEKMDTLPPEFTVGVDEGLILNRNWAPTPIYKSLIDVPDTAYATGAIAKTEIGRALHFWWAKNKTFIDGIPTPFNSKNETIISYTMDADYYITNKKLDYPTIFEQNGVFVYSVKPL